MLGTMMGYPLTLAPLLHRAGQLFPGVEIVSRLPDNSIHRETYREVTLRATALAGALQRLGLRRGERVATLMWNHYAHLEAYFGIPIVGGVLHTLNVRLHPDELAYIVNHAEDRFLIVDDVLLPLYEQMRAKVKFERVFVLRHSGMPLPEGCEDYEAWIGECSQPVDYPALDENEAAAMCYTSGTTGKPKGVVYSHRALVLHSFAIALPDHFAISRRDVVLPAMSMFHANAWGLPYAAVMAGSKLVFPGPSVHPESLLELLVGERVTLTGGVPTIWLAVLQCLEKDPSRWQLQPGLRVLVAGSAAPESIFRRFDRFGVQAIHFWGMTETTPAATFCTLQPKMESWPDDRKYLLRSKQGLPSPFIDLRAMGDTGEVPWDGASVGELQVKGPWVTASYFRSDAARQWTADGWLRTGDVVNIDPNGYIKITDRQKDLIKSGGEWISSVDLENAIVSHPAIAEAAVIAVAHPKWQERPLALIVLKEGAKLDASEIRSLLASSFAKWQLPDDFVFVERLPHTSTGKLLKSQLREDFKDYFARTVGA
jgi:acyl-CoA synthetase (AMP-forming)/AMP-acid ligase II